MHIRKLTLNVLRNPSPRVKLDNTKDANFHVRITDVKTLLELHSKGVDVVAGYGTNFEKDNRTVEEMLSAPNYEADKAFPNKIVASSQIHSQSSELKEEIEKHIEADENQDPQDPSAD